MSEEILRALMKLFALISKQDDGSSSEERNYVENFLKHQLSEKNYGIYLQLFDEFVGDAAAAAAKKKPGRVTMIDSVKIIGVCEKINSTLIYKQKVIVLLRLFELLKSQNNKIEQKLELLETVADVFRLEAPVMQKLKSFVFDELANLSADLVCISDREHVLFTNKIFQDGLKGELHILRLEDDLYFLKGNAATSDILLNGLPIYLQGIHVFSNGSILKFPKGKPVYFSDVSVFFLKNRQQAHLSFEAKDIEYQFPNKALGLRDVCVSENEGKLIGIMGASGAGKTTLLNALMGNLPLTKGHVQINGLDVSKDRDKLHGVIGYVPQDDLLIEELTVFQNLLYSAKLCFDHLSEEEIIQRVHKTLSSLGLLEIKDLKVGSPLNKTISGGQRKRLNIALELIREPSVIFFDEPTSGLSSRDSENVIDLLRELSYSGKLVFVVIHQPSSDIYKMFDRIIIMDVGGYQIYCGNPIEAVSYFKRIDRQINSEISECPNCGNVNPELIFNIIEAKVIDEYGRLTDERKVTPLQWRKHYEQHLELEKEFKSTQEEIPKNLFIPKKLKQFKIFATRDILSKISNTQYILINLLEAPILGFFLSFFIRYTQDPQGGIYLFRENDNIPSYIFMGVIVSVFIGLTVSAEEIFRDKKILRREMFLNLSRHSYLSSKIAILFVLSAVQSLLFVLIGNFVLEIKNMLLPYWLMFFSIFCVSNLVGLNISSAFNSAVTIYIIIPILVIPQMILGGAMFSFEKINTWAGGGYDVPAIAELMPSRWAYEGLMVHQFKENDYEKHFFISNQKISKADFRIHYLLPELDKKIDFCRLNLYNKSPEVVEKSHKDIKIIQREIEKENIINSFLQYKKLSLSNPNLLLNEQSLSEIKLYIDVLKVYYQKVQDTTLYKKEKLTYVYQSDSVKSKLFNQLFNRSHNESIQDLVKKSQSKITMLETSNELQQIIDPIYHEPISTGLIQLKYHFFSPIKYLFKVPIGTFWYNILVLWFYGILLYIFLYYDILSKIMGLFQRH